VKEADPCAAEAFARYVAQLEAEAAAAEALEGGIVRRQNEVPPLLPLKILADFFFDCLSILLLWVVGRSKRNLLLIFLVAPQKVYADYDRRRSEHRRKTDELQRFIKEQIASKQADREQAFKARKNTYAYSLLSFQVAGVDSTQPLFAFTIPCYLLEGCYVNSV